MKSYYLKTLNELLERVEALEWELQHKIDILNASVVSLMERVDILEAHATLFNSTYSTSIDMTTETMDWVDMDDMSTTIILNRSSHLIIMFSAEAKVEGDSPEFWTDASIRIRALVEDVAAYPGDVYLTPTISQELGYPASHRHKLDWCAYSYTFYLLSVSAGTHTIKLQWRVTESTGYVHERTLSVIIIPA